MNNSRCFDPLRSMVSDVLSQSSSLEISRILSRLSPVGERKGKSEKARSDEYAVDPRHRVRGIESFDYAKRGLFAPLLDRCVHPPPPCIVIYAPWSIAATCTRVTRGTHSQQWRCVGGKVLLIANTANISATSDAAQRRAIMRQLLTRRDYAVEVASAEPRTLL